MKRSSPWIVTLATCQTLFLGGCFNPDYGQGGFTCPSGTCPEGYGCVCEGNGKQRCKKGAATKLCTGGDLGPTPDMLADKGPAPDASSAFTCNKPEAVTNNIEVVHHGIEAIDLVLDTKGAPHVVYVNDKLKIHSRERSAKGDWSDLLRRNILTNFKSIRVAAAINGKNHLVAIFAKDEVLGTGKLYSSWLNLSKAAALWETPHRVDDKMYVTSLDIAGDPLGGDSSLYYAQTGNEKAGTSTTTNEFILSKMEFKSGLMAYAAVTPPIVHTTDPAIKYYHFMRVTLGARGTVRHAVASVWTQDSSDHDQYNWRFGVCSLTSAKCTLSTERIPAGRISSHAAGTVDQSVYLAYGQNNHSTTSPGFLGQAFLGVIPATTTKITSGPFIKFSVVDPYSIEIAQLASQAPCLLYWMLNSVAQQMELRLACQLKQSQWASTAPLSSYSYAKPASTYLKGYPTRLVVDSKGLIHMIYTHPKGNYRGLSYRTCKLPPP